jgi:hypothetical protein
MRFKLAAAIGIGALLVGATAISNASLAWGAAPPNDEFSNATVISSLPFQDTVPDLGQATFNPSTDQSNCGGGGATVWYQFTPPTSGPIAFDMAGSSDFFPLDVFTGIPGSWTNVGCSQFGLIVNLTAGTTYWIMVSDSFTGARLNLAVYPAVAPQATVTVNSTGKVDRGRNALISGTVNCTGFIPNPGSVAGQVRQVYKRIYSITADFNAPSGCSGAQAWSGLAQPTTGGFAVGYVTVNAAASFCNIAGCASPSITEVIRLRN